MGISKAESCAPDLMVEQTEIAARHALSAIALCVATVVAAEAHATPLAYLGITLAVWFSVLGTMRALMAAGYWLRAPHWPGVGLIVRLASSAALNGFLAFGAFATFISLATFRRGRQLRRFGRVQLPEVAPGGAWAGLQMDAHADPQLREGLAAQWRENGRTEHASVAAFARLTLDLIALGAPPELIAAANGDALDEIRHAELCFSLARELDGRAASPGPFPAANSTRTLPPGRLPALAALAVDSLVDGALHEGVSAAVIARVAKGCADPRTRAMLREIAADEGRHSAHGWDVVEWCLAEGGAPVLAALQGAVRALPVQMTGEIPAGAEDGAWERWGIHGRRTEAEEFARMRAEIVRRVSAAALRGAGPAPRRACAPRSSLPPPAPPSETASR